MKQYIDKEQLLEGLPKKQEIDCDFDGLITFKGLRQLGSNQAIELLTKAIKKCDVVEGKDINFEWILQYLTDSHMEGQYDAGCKELSYSNARRDCENKAKYLTNHFVIPKSVEVDELINYCTHGFNCILSEWREGKSTEDGDYLTLYGYGNNEKYYSRNKGENPECTCGLDELIKKLKKPDVPKRELCEKKLLEIVYAECGYDEASEECVKAINQKYQSGELFKEDNNG